MKFVTAAQFELLKISLERAGSITFEVTSGSMSPLLEIGNTVSVRPLNQSQNIHRFDILVFLQMGQLICHYLHHVNKTGISDKKFVTRALKGGEDLPLSADEILGIVSSHGLPWWKKIALSFRV